MICYSFNFMFPNLRQFLIGLLDKETGIEAFIDGYYGIDFTQR